MSAAYIDGSDRGVSCGNFMDDLPTNEDRDLEILFRVAISQGLPSNYIMKLISAIESKETNKKVKFKLMECMIPRETIPEEAFIRMTCLLSDFKFCLTLKVEILKWMITVYSFKKETPLGRFRYLYEIFFKLLEQEKLRPYVCHLMFLITRKELITPRRVNCIFKLIEKYGKQPCFVLVLHSYFILCPEYFDGEIDEDFEYDFESLGIYPSLIKHVHPLYELHVSNVHVTTLEVNSTEILSESSTRAVEKSCDTLSFRLGSFHETYQELKTLEISTNISEILKSRLRRLFLTSDLPPKSKIKLNDYILTLLYKNLDSNEFLEDMLEIFLDIQHSILPCDVSNLTEDLVSLWDNNLNADIVSEILSYEPLSCFEKISYKMDLIREKLLKSSVSVKCQLLNCFSKIYLNWVLYTIENNNDSFVPCDGRCFASNDDKGNSSTVCQVHLQSDEIYKLGSYIDLICNALILDDCHPCLLNEILLHYERVSIAHMKADRNLVIHLPTCPVFHLALFSLSAFTLDNLCRLMLRCSAEIRHMQLKSNPEAKLATHYFKLCSHDLQKVLLQGCYVKDANTYLSRTNVFRRLKEKCPNFENMFMLHQHPALSLKTMHFDNKNNLHNFQTDRDVRLNFCQHITEDGPKNLIKLVTLLM